ncbi:hypothetical protein ABIF68_010399 [Bradyrhizobium japonicum]|jgi:hypothetical protein|uniref:hypothetical protein n=1 Tax=Bradyrhizobium TaxID=374 RepID=UPI0004AFB8BF|nr:MULTISPECIES: hypothetical protein [Bradyrhizobium]MDI2076507.1 hypothetical protein [Bradyrhizobium sp. Mp27]
MDWLDGLAKSGAVQRTLWTAREVGIGSDLRFFTEKGIVGMPRPPEDFVLPNLREPITGKAKRLQNLEPHKGQGRPRGATAKIVRDLKEALVESAIQHGRDGKGKDGLTGFCTHLLINHPRVHGALLAKLLPLQVNSDSPAAMAIGSVVINSIPSGHYLSHEDVARMAQPGIVDHIELAPLKRVEPEPPKPMSRVEERAELEKLTVEELMALARARGFDVDGLTDD